MDTENEVRCAVGVADACEILAVATMFPTPELAQALCEGGMQDDARACLEDCGASCERAAQAVLAWDDFNGADQRDALSQIRRGYSLLFVRQKEGVAVWPYESAHFHRAEGKKGEPVLFRSPLTLAVEEAMKKENALPQDARVEPCDSVWNEFGFMAKLYGRKAVALAEGSEEMSRAHGRAARAFVEEHILAWLPRFFDEVARRSKGPDMDELARSYYQGLSAYAREVLLLLEKEE